MRTVLAMCLLSLIGCVHARDPQIIAVTQQGDSSLTCEQIATEYIANTEVARNKITKNRSEDKKELLLGILVWPGLFDLKNADGNEANGLLDRNVYLRELGRTKSCVGTESWPEQPHRYSMRGLGTAS